MILGETLVGLALILGAFTGVAAFFGVFTNASFLFAGTAGANPLMALVGVLLVLAWRVAGRWGLDRWILPAIACPGRRARCSAVVAGDRLATTAPVAAPEVCADFGWRVRGSLDGIVVTNPRS